LSKLHIIAKSATNYKHRNVNNYLIFLTLDSLEILTLVGFS